MRDGPGCPLTNWLAMGCGEGVAGRPAEFSTAGGRLDRLSLEPLDKSGQHIARSRATEVVVLAATREGYVAIRDFRLREAPGWRFFRDLLIIVSTT